MTTSRRHIQRDESALTGAARSLDRILQLCEQGSLSPTELRVLLCLLEHRQADIAELVEALAASPADMTRAGRRLAVRGLVRSHQGGSPEHSLLEVTAAGAAAIGSLLAAIGASASQRPGAPRGDRDGHWGP